jgi:hypothetical protein
MIVVTIASVMRPEYSEIGDAGRPPGFIAKTSRRVAVALTMSTGVGLPS